MKGNKKVAKNRSPQWAFMQVLRIPNYRKPELYHTDYLWRLRILQTPWFGIFLHKINDVDPNQMFHDHPWNFWSFVLSGGYMERFASGEFQAWRLNHLDLLMDKTKFRAERGRAYRTWTRFSFHRVLMNQFHYVVDVRPRTWTLLFVGKRRTEPFCFKDPELGLIPFYDHPSNALFEEAMALRKAS